MCNSPADLLLLGVFSGLEFRLKEMKGLLVSVNQLVSIESASAPVKIFCFGHPELALGEIVTIKMLYHFKPH